MQPWALITPASRGIGLHVARRVLQTTDVPVVATARGDVDETRERILEGLEGVDGGRLRVLKVDVTDESTIASAASECASAFPKDQSHYLHLAFLLPGLLFPERSPAQVNADDALLTFRTNTLGPLLLMKHFSPFLPNKRTPLPTTLDVQPDNKDNKESEAGGTEDDGPFKGLPPRHATWSTLSARVGSISDNKLGGWYSYRASKAAVNQLTKTFDLHLRATAGDKAMAVALHPGTVRTGLSREFWGSVRKEKLFEPEWVARRLVGLVTGKGLEEEDGKGGEGVRGIGIEGRGRCWDWAGREVPP